VVLLLLPQLLVVLLPLEVLLLRRRKKRRKRVRITAFKNPLIAILTVSTAKEESDEDMGFGLFD
jgi:hypothetical protein